jgi:hypothetical protein
MSTNSLCGYSVCKKVMLLSECTDCKCYQNNLNSEQNVYFAFFNVG